MWYEEVVVFISEYVANAKRIKLSYTSPKVTKDSISLKIEPYKEIVLGFNTKGILTYSYTKVGNTIYKQIYTYHRNGLPASVLEHVIDSNEISSVSIFEYDQFSRIKYESETSPKVLEDEALINERVYEYKEDGTVIMLNLNNDLMCIQHEFKTKYDDQKRIIEEITIEIESEELTFWLKREYLNSKENYIQHILNSNGEIESSCIYTINGEYKPSNSQLEYEYVNTVRLDKTNGYIDFRLIEGSPNYITEKTIEYF